MRKLKLLFAAAALMGGVCSGSAQSWVAPTIAGEDPVAGTQYKVMNVGAGKFLDMGKAWFGWSTTAILSDNGVNFTMTADGDNWKFIRTGTQGVFTSGNGIPGDAMHVDNTANTYGITKLPNGYYQIHDAATEYTTCWGYIEHNSVWGPVAHADISTIGDKGEWAFLSLVTAEAYKTRLKLYDRLNTAYSEGADTDAAAAVYNNANATVDELNAAYSELNLARLTKYLEGKTASKENPIDITEYVLVNPDFEVATSNGQMPPGWTITIGGANCGQQNRTDTNPETSLAITNFIEAWHWQSITPGVIAQTVTSLPEGTYVLECDASVCHDPEAGDGTDIEGAYLFIKSSLKTEQEAVGNLRLRINHYSVSFSHGGDGEVQFGLKATEKINANWLSADNFKIYYAGPMDLSVYKTLLEEAVANFEAKESSLDTDAFSNLKTIVDGQNKNYSSSSEYKTAISNINTINDYVGDLVTANAVDQNAKMNATVLSALQTEIDNATSVTLAGIADAITALTTATANATTSIANYAEAKTILEAASIYDAAGQESYAANETIAAIQTAYDDATLTAVSAEQKTAAQAALATACKAQTQPKDNCDMTPWIMNPNFDGNADGWTTEKRGDGWTAEPYNNGQFIEYWTPSVINETNSTRFFDYYQSITSLPSGAYTISAEMLNSTNNEEKEEGHESVDWNGGGNAGVYGKTASNEVQKLITINDQTLRLYTTDEILVVDGELRIGVKNINPLTGRWFKADNFKLTYVRQLTADEKEEIAKANAVIAYNEALAAAQAITDGTIPTPAYTNLQDVITANTLKDGTSTQYNDAAAALNEAATTAAAMVAPYAAWKTLKTQADALVAVDSDNDTAKGTLSSAISTQNAAAEAATTASAIVDATTALKTAMTTYAGVANPVGDNARFDLTFMLTNPDVTSYWDGTWWIAPDGWYRDQEGGNFQVMNNNSVNAEDNIHDIFMEYYYLSNNTTWDNGKFNIYTKATLPAGTYTMNCYAFAKEVNYTSADPNGQVYFYANDTQGSRITSEKLAEQSISFVNESEQEVKIGLKPLAGNTYNWMGIGYVKLYKVPAQTYEVDETKAWDNTIAGAGDVTLKRTIKAGINTLVLPFSMTQAEVEANFGADSKVYAVSSYDDAVENISFVSKDGISANQPCLLKATVAGTNYTLADRTIVAGDPVANATNVKMTGTYAASMTVEKDAYNYIISGGKIYFVDSDVTLKNTRAYITLTTPSAARTLTMSFDGGETTGIATIENGELKVETGVIYDLQGRKVNNPAKGLYILNGKKVIK